MVQLTIQQAIDLAVQHHQAGRLVEAERIYRQILDQQPTHADAMHNLGVLMLNTRRNDAALELFRRVVVLWPNFGEAYSNLGIALKNRGEFDEAIAAWRQSVTLRPHFPEARNNLGNALRHLGQFEEAIASYRQALALRPAYAEVHSNLACTLLYHPAYDSRAIAEELREWNRQHAEPLRKLIQPHANERNPDRRLRIGYVSPDFCDHVVGRNLLPLFQQQDRQEFEITCYANVPGPDAMTQQFQQHADRWRNIFAVSDEKAADQIREDEIDILVDLALHTAGNRLLIFARKPAPVQASFAGYPGSTGLSTIDYRLSDPYLDPVGMDESIYSEKTVRLPDSFWCYDPLKDRDVLVNSLPARESGIVTFGSLNNLFKINDGVLRLWAAVLREVKEARLLMMAPKGSRRQWVLDQLGQGGIVASRVEFVPRQSYRAYLESYHRIDIGLDSFPYGGHTTSLDSFWMGVPVVTLVGKTAVSRAGWCQLSNLGLTELAARTPEGFVRIAVELARDLLRLGELRRTLRGRMERSPLMDAPKFARNMEAAFRRMWRAWCETAAAKS